MNHLGKSVLALMLSLAILTGSGCSAGGNVSSVSSETSAESAQQDQADPVAALDEIYESVTVKGIHDADDTVASETIGLDLDMVDAYYIRYADGSFGLADVYIVKPTVGNADKVKEQLMERRDSRIREFEKFNVLDAQNISKNAEIFEQGGYVIMLMLPDNESARTIIDRYIEDDLKK